MSVYIGDVQTFAGVIADKPQVLKVIEESAEVFSAWERLRVFDSDEVKGRLVEEIADTIQACANLLAAIDVDDMRQPMQVCYVRNAKRGREYSSSDDMDSAVYVQKCPNESCRQYADQGERAELPDCESDSREKLEADVRDWAITTNAIFPENRVKSVKGFLDRQAAITERECRKPNWDYCDTCETLKDVNFECEELQEQVDNQKKSAENFRDMWQKADARCTELKAENDGLKARIESLRTKLSKMLDAASEIQHIGDLP